VNGPAHYQKAEVLLEAAGIAASKYENGCEHLEEGCERCRAMAALLTAQAGMHMLGALVMASAGAGVTGAREWIEAAVS
jgi:hypothetical protein